MADPSGFMMVCITDGGGGGGAIPQDTGEVEPYYHKTSNLAATIYGTAVGVLGKVSKKVIGYVDKSSVINFYPKSSIVHKVMPYAGIAKKLSTVFLAVTAGLDVASTWDPMIKMSIGQRIGKTALQLAGIGLGIAVGTWISGPLLATGMASGGMSMIGGIIGSGVIDYCTASLVGMGQDVIYKKYGLK